MAGLVKPALASLSSSRRLHAGVVEHVRVNAAQRLVSDLTGERQIARRDLHVKQLSFQGSPT
jgi:hypothetical protein